jgi:dihydroflavonol-4-reductase
MTARRGPVLVTGATGFLAGWCVIELLRRGHPVRATVRELRAAADVRAALGTLAPDAHIDAVQFVAADLTEDRGWDEAMRGCVGALHVASPFPRRQPRDPNELIRPARDGTVRVLTAADQASVPRVVVTSSTAAIAYHDRHNGPLDETRWTDEGHPLGRRPYARSKILAERAAWEIAAGLKTELTVICPGTLLGPPTGPRLSYSVTPIEMMLTGKMTRLPRVGFPFVDVRDVAALHVTALREPAAAGQRYVAVAEFRWLADIAAVLRRGLGAEAAEVPTKPMPDPAVRALALIRPSLRQVAAELGREQHFTTTKARSELGWQPRPIEDTILDCARGVKRNLTQQPGGTTRMTNSQFPQIPRV